MTHAWHEEHQANERTAWGITWGITAPWAHPFWSQYVAFLYDLTSDVGDPPTIYLPSATHEFMLQAIDPELPLKEDVPVSQQRYTLLEPPNYGYQFRAASNEAAKKMIDTVIASLVGEKLNPDTDARQAWDLLFQGSYPLVSSGLSGAVFVGGSPRTRH